MVPECIQMKRSKDKRQYQIRMDNDFEKRIRKYQAKLLDEGLEVSFASAARTLIDQSLKREGIR